MYLYQQGIKGLPESAIQIKRKKHEVLTLLKDTPDALMMVDTDIALIEFLDTLLPKLEWQVHVKAKQHDRKSFALLQTIDGLGEMLGLTILYEMHTANRFKTVQRFSSYSRVVKVSRFSAGKKLGSKNSKIGNPYLRWAFGQVAVLSTKYYPEIKRYYERRKKKYGTKKALAILAHKFAVAVYYMLKKGKPFDVAQFIVA
jgi:transposase